MSSAQDVVTALHQWAVGAAADGHPVPARQELDAIGRRPDSWRRDISASPVALWWGATIDHLIIQVRLGVLPAIAVAHLPADVAPAGPAPAESGAGGRHATHATGGVGTGSADTRAEADPPTSDDPTADLMTALIAWRGRKIAEGAEGAETIKDITLRNLAKRAPVTAEQIRKKLPGAAGLVDELAGVFAEFGAAGVETAGRAVNPAVSPAAAYPAANAQAAGSATPGQNPAVARSADPVPDLLPLTHGDFSDYEYLETDVEPGTVNIASTPDGVRLSWDAFDGAPTVLYRVVSGDGMAPYKPEAGELLAVTTGTAAEDTRFLTTAVRHYQVWVHAGEDEGQARAAQPVKWAQGQDISPVEDMRITEDEGRVVGEWSAFSGTRAVRIFRIPLDEGGPITTDPRYQICVTDANLTGFVDADVPRGRRYLYRAQAEVPVGDSLRLSRPAQQEILVSVDLVSVTDLEVSISENNSLFDLSWTTPEGGQEVRIYRFPEAPPAGLEREDLPAEALSVQGFTDATRVRHPVKAGTDPTRSQMSGVPWPGGWDRAYLTPVTVAAGRARIGETRVLARPLPAVEEPHIVERFHCEMITFGWPRGAAAVRAYIGPAGIDAEQVCQGKPFGEVSAEQYERDGALILARTLTAKGCLVWLVPVSYSAGREIAGEPVSVAYPGLARMAYELEPVPTGPGQIAVRLVLHAETPVADLPPLVLVHHPQRLPLDTTDGRTLRFHSGRGQLVPHCQVVGELPQGRQPTEWVADLTGVVGYVRVFVHDTERRGQRPIAMLDPPMPGLRLLPPAPPRGEW
ncbi:hypothetical protein GOARA_015_00080 [Gordonia araii NBRC 100433]|uniref:Uncharacterized protein n=1 Tax=Gordonia araii NBRC 100433 TaxID=1073574 RepID=G7GYJ5_9ACTN|nr:hypothetical protein [Gordonia araii]NNG97470.1 hypothetical protein [Gordonia araii NBRC 100433]GAB08670.1 hypothetical protein GOARA_015_00080 [Gordonia araii NBRC 100433]